MSIKKALLAGSIVGVSLLAGVVAGLPSGAFSGGSGSTSNTNAPSTAPTPVASSAPASRSGTCDATVDDQWPDKANGRPAGLDANDLGGVYLWHDQDGWHLRVTHRGDDAKVLTGTIWTGGTFGKPTPVKLEKDDKVAVGPENHVMTFRFVNYGGIDGIDFTTHCADALHINFKVDGHELALDRVFVGHTSFHPLSMPFVIDRQQ
jgi:hypothetical protein